MLKVASSAGSVALVAGLLDILAHYWAVAPHGSEAGLVASVFIAGSILLASLLACGLSLVLLPFPARRRFAARALCAGLVSLVVLTVSVRIGGELRMRGFADLARRSMTLIRAIERFEAEQGHPPSALSDLVPTYLDSIPDTSMAAYPAYDYFSGEDAASIYGDRWAISVFAPSAGINFDQFYFIPSGNYPPRGLGGSIERVEDWAYVHE